MAKYVYPAVFTKDGDGYSISFPDLDGCYTCGDDLANGMEMAEDALALFLYNFERESRPIPAATPLEKVSSADDSFVTYVYCDTLVYQKRNNNRAVKKPSQYLNGLMKQLLLPALISPRFCRTL